MFTHCYDFKRSQYIEAKKEREKEHHPSVGEGGCAKKPKLDDESSVVSFSPLVHMPTCDPSSISQHQQCDSWVFPSMVISVLI